MTLRNIKVGDKLDLAWLDLKNLTTNYQDINEYWKLYESGMKYGDAILTTDKGNKLVYSETNWYMDFSVYVEYGGKRILLDMWEIDDGGQFGYPSGYRYLFPEDFGTVTSLNSNAIKLLEQLRVFDEQVSPQEYPTPTPSEDSNVAVAKNINNMVINGKKIIGMAINSQVIYGRGGSSVKIVPFSTGTDDEITAMLEAHYNGDIDIADYWHVGDARVIHISDIPSNSPYAAESYSAQDIPITIIGIDHDKLKTPIGIRNNAAITVQSHIVSWNNNGSNGSWSTYFWGTALSDYGKSLPATTNYSDCPRRQWFNNDFIKALPSKIGANVKTVIKKNLANHTDSKAGPDTEDKAFVLSVSELFGNNIGYMNGTVVYRGDESLEGKQYEFYRDLLQAAAKTIRQKTQQWWESMPSSCSEMLRSPIVYTSYNGGCWASVYLDASYNGQYPYLKVSLNDTFLNSALGLSPVFCL